MIFGGSYGWVIFVGGNERVLLGRATVSHYLWWTVKHIKVSIDQPSTCEHMRTGYLACQCSHNLTLYESGLMNSTVASSTISWTHRLQFNTTWESRVLEFDLINLSSHILYALQSLGFWFLNRSNKNFDHRKIFE